MTTDEQWARVLELWGDRGWPWRHGMQWFEFASGYGRVPSPMPAGAFPDTTDPATLGALLGLVREVWSTWGTGSERCREMYVEPGPSGWRVRGAWLPPEYVTPPGSLSLPPRPTEGEALLAALIAGLERAG